MKTVTIQIGNSDDKLTQKDWSHYIRDADMYIRAYGEVHFCGSSHADAEWQNFCWVVNVEFDKDLPKLKRLIGNVSREYRQDSIAWTEGNTEFI